MTQRQAEKKAMRLAQVTGREHFVVEDNSLPPEQAPYAVCDENELETFFAGLQPIFSSADCA